jgi:putative ABC transport system permease protein
LHDEDAKNILDIPYRNRLSIIAPKILGAVEVEGRQALLAGVDFESELLLKRWWKIVGRQPDSDQEVLVGYEVARALSIIEPSEEPASSMPDMPDMPDMSSHRTLDDHGRFKIVRERLQIAGREHRIAGVIAQTAGPEDQMILGRLAQVQSLLGKPGQLSLVEVSALCKDCPVEDIVAQISERLPHAKVSAIQQSVRARNETVERLTRFSAVVAAVVLAIGALMIFTTMMGSVIERTKEIGVLRAIGFRRVHIIKGLVIEVAVISVIGGLIGWATGLLASWAALPYFAETEVGLEVEPALALVAVAAALLVGILSSFYPILRASRLDPSEAVRYV